MKNLLKVTDLVRYDCNGNVVLRGSLYTDCYIHAKSPVVEDRSDKVATTEWVKAYTATLSLGGGGGIGEETDPIYSAQIGMYYTKLQSDARYLQSFTEVDPVWNAEKVNYYTKTQADNRYLQSFTELDPTVPSHVKSIGTLDISHWTSAYNWGNHALAGYLTSFTETDPIWISEKANYYTKTQADARYLQSFTETDPIWTADKPSYYTKTQADARYLQSFTETDPVWSLEKTNYYTKTQGDARYLQSYTETDPIWISEKANYATKVYVDTGIANLVDSAPAALNTLKELATALGNDANFSTSITTLIGTKEPAIAAGTTLQYWRGDKTWQTLNTTAVTEGTNLYFTTARARASFSAGSNVTIDANGVISSSYTNTWNANSINVAGYVAAPGGGTNKYWKTDDNGNPGWYDLQIATTTRLGGVKSDGSTIAISIDGTISAINSYSLPTATASVLGGVKIGSGITITAGVISVSTAYEPTITAGTTAQYWRGDKTWQTLPTYTLPVATDTVLGGIKVGSGLSINAGGTLSVSYAYSLPTASATVLGGIKVGTNLSIDANGVLSSTDTNTTYGLITPATTTPTLRLTISSGGYNEITLSSTGGTTITRVSNGELRFSSPDVSGFVPYTGATANVDLSSTYTMTAKAFYESSDIRFKNVLETNPVVEVASIDVIKFTRKGDTDVRYGYSAQQVRQFVPEAVTGGDMLTVNYTDVHTLKIAALERRIAELEARLNESK